jgi:signal transduction protein with GAF and PtsI domain
VLGHLFGFHPGSVGLWVAVIGGLAAGVAVLVWQDHVQDRDMKLLEANQRKITDPWDRRQLIEAHQAAKTALDVWPHLPLDEKDVKLRLRTALWQLTSVFPERQQLRDTLTELSRATYGVLAGAPAAAELAVRIEHARALYQARDDEVRERIEHLKALASRCQRFYDEQRAIQRARQVSRRADAVLSTFGTTGQMAGAIAQPAEDIGVFTQHVAAVLDAYGKLGNDISGENS